MLVVNASLSGGVLSVQYGSPPRQFSQELLMNANGLDQPFLFLFLRLPVCGCERVHMQKGCGVSGMGEHCDPNALPYSAGAHTVKS